MGDLHPSGVKDRLLLGVLTDSHTYNYGYHGAAVPRAARPEST